MDSGQIILAVYLHLKDFFLQLYQKMCKHGFL